MPRKISKRGKPRSFRAGIETDRLLNEYMSKHAGKFNETDVIDTSIKCFLSNPECVARLVFERDYKIKTK